jgi:hypothetical protein
VVTGWCPLLSNESPKLIAQKFMIFFFEKAIIDGKQRKRRWWDRRHALTIATIYWKN